MTKIICESELMENQKAGHVLPAPGNFEAIQNADNHPLFFFIDANDNFTLCAEHAAQNTGWTLETLSTDLSPLNGSKAITAKAFDVTQDYSTGEISIALAVQVEGEDNDRLYLLTGLSDAADAAWMTDSASRSWLYRAYDGPALSGDLIISDLYMKASMESHVVCELQNETTQALSNYMVNSSGTAGWAKITGANDFTTLLGQVIGKPSAAAHAGLYQLTQDASHNTALQFLPMSAGDSPITLSAPTGASRIASLTDESGKTDLYVAANGAVYLFPADAQTANAAGTKILEHSLIAGIQDFHCHQNDNYTLIWALNQQGEVFYSQCEKGGESDSKNWSVPLPLVDDAQRLSTYFTDSNEHSVIFVHKEGDDLVQYTQDSETTFWHERHILLQSQNPADYVQSKTFTTHVQVTDDNNLPLAGQSLSITSSSPCSVYINNHFCFLSPDSALSVSCDNAGCATIIQDTKNLGAVCYSIGVVGGLETPVTVNPMTKMITTMTAITSGTDLGNVQVTNSQGIQSPLVGADISSDSKDATAKALQGFMKLTGSLPQNGKIQNEQTRVREILGQPHVAKGYNPARDKIWAVSYEGPDVRYLEDGAALAHFGMTLDEGGTIHFPAGDVGGIWQFIKSTAGDVYQYCKHSVESVAKFLVSHVGGVIQIFVTIGKSMYRFVANCLSDVMHAADVIFKKIKVALHKLVEWLGFVFQWPDIKRSHQVTKNVIRQYLNSVPGRISGLQSGLDDLFDNIQDNIDSWAQLDKQPSWHTKFGGSQHSLGGIGSAAAPNPGAHSPQANYGSYHLKHGMKKAVLGNSSYSPPELSDQIKGLIATLKSAVTAESQVIQSAITALETNIVGHLETLSFADLATKLIAIMGDLVVGSTKTLLDASLGLIAQLIEGIVNILDTPITIPILSALYKKATGNDLSILDALCFVASMGATVIYKIAKGAAPFPDDATTTSLITADSWAEIKTAFQNAVTPPRQQALQLEAQGSTNTKAVFIIFFHFVATFGGGMVMLVAASEERTKSAAAAETKVTAFFLATLPVVIANLINSTTQTKAVKMSEALYGITCAQNLLTLGFDAFAEKWGGESAGALIQVMKKANGFFDVLFGAISLVPPIWIAYDNTNKTTIAGAITESCWNLNRMAGGAIAMAGGPTKLPRVFAFRMVCLSGYMLMNTIFLFFVSSEEEPILLQGAAD